MDTVLALALLVGTGVGGRGSLGEEAEVAFFVWITAPLRLSRFLPGTKGPWVVSLGSRGPLNREVGESSSLCGIFITCAVSCRLTVAWGSKSMCHSRTGAWEPGAVVTDVHLHLLACACLRPQH